MDIMWKRKSGLHIAAHIYKDWFVRVPQVKNRLHRNGTVGFSIPERYEFKGKKGLLLIDSTARQYVFIPLELFEKYTPEMKDYNGVKKSLAVWNVKQIIEDHNLELIPVPREEDYVPAHEQGISGDVRRKFGL